MPPASSGHFVTVNHVPAEGLCYPVSPSAQRLARGSDEDSAEPAAPLADPAPLPGDSRGASKPGKALPGRPGGPTYSIVSVEISPSRQGPALDTSSASASPTLTALALLGRRVAELHVPTPLSWVWVFVLTFLWTRHRASVWSEEDVGTGLIG